jgi:hypothetical protein
MAIDLDQVVLVNDSRDPNVAGNVQLFKTIVDAERYLEPNDVQNSEYFAYFLDGRELNLLVVPQRRWFGEIDTVRIEPAAVAHHVDRVRSLLEGAAAAVHAARKRLHGIEPERKPSDMSIVELTELIGFTR